VERWNLQDAQKHFGAELTSVKGVGMKVLPLKSLKDASHLIPTEIKGTKRQKWV
jgi:hypothetical protein